jgi:thioredoxin reductase (NADPH)
MDRHSVAPAGTIETDAVVIGAGPVGLFQVFELGLLEIRAHVVDSLPYPGGQCVELYADKPIYDIPGVPVCTGRELTANLLRQVEPFGTTFHYGQEVTTVQPQEDGRFFLETSKGTRFLTRTVFIAAGVGAFQPRKLKVEGIEKFEGSQVRYFADLATGFDGKHVVVIGGDDAAVDWATKLATRDAGRAGSVTLLHRRDALQASPASVATLNTLRDEKRMRFVVGQVTACEEEQGALKGLRVTGPDAVTQQLSADMLFVFLGLSPKLGPIAQWGLDLERKQLKVDTETFSTSVPGIFAVGDINTYPGKKKLILSGFHECALAAFGAAPFINPDKPVQLQYTTTSTKLHKVLGVESPVFERD